MTGSAFGKVLVDLVTTISKVEFMRFYPCRIAATFIVFPGS